jgi:hypothetical protein
MGAPALAFVLAGLFPLGLVVAGYWDARSVLIVYWVELLVLGFFTMCRILLVRSLPVGLRMLAAVFFYTMFFGFCSGYGLFIAHMVGVKLPPMAMNSYLADIFSTVRHLMQAMPKFGWIAVLTLIVSHGVSFLTEWIAKRDFRVMQLVQRLILRGAVLHVIRIAGGAIALNSPALSWVAMALIFAKIGIDVYGERAAPNTAAAVAAGLPAYPPTRLAPRRASATIDSLASAPRLSRIDNGVGADLVLDPNPGSIGGDVAGFVDVALPPGGHFFLWLDEIGDYRKAASSINWTEGGQGKVEPGPRGMRISFRFAPPAERRPSGPWETRSGDPSFGEPPRQVRWQLCVEGAGKSWVFEIPVGVLVKQSAVFAELPDTGKSGAPRIPAALLYRIARSSALILEEPPQVGLGQALFGAVIGVAIMWAVGPSNALGGNALWFFLGAAILFGSIYLSGLRTRTEVRPAMLTLRKWWFGLSVTTRVFALAAIDAVATRVQATSPRNATTYKTLLRLRDGSEVELFDSIKDSRQAEALRRLIERRLEGETEPDLEKLISYRSGA